MASRLISAFIFMLLTMPCKSQDAVEKIDSIAPKISFENTVHDFGKLKKGTSEKYNFVFTNKGSEPLVISSVQKSCVCTKVKWPRKPLAKGEKGIVTVTYNAKDRGTFYRSITVYSNSGEKSVKLYVKGSVE